VLALHVAVAAGGLGALVWEACKVGALSYGGGFVIIPLMQHDAVTTYHWMTGAQFLNAVALGQITPGPVVQTVAVVGYASAGLGGGILAAVIAFTPSFVFILAGGPRFHRIRADRAVEAFLTGTGRDRGDRRVSHSARLGACAPLADPRARRGVALVVRPPPRRCRQWPAHRWSGRHCGGCGRSSRVIPLGGLDLLDVCGPLHHNVELFAEDGGPVLQAVTAHGRPGARSGRPATSVAITTRAIAWDCRTPSIRSLRRSVRD
jgi:hypothetical protein